MIQCTICKNRIQELYLEKKRGTVIKKTGSSKLYDICSECQTRFKTKEELLKAIS